MAVHICSRNAAADNKFVQRLDVRLPCKTVSGATVGIVCSRCIFASSQYGGTLASKEHAVFLNVMRVGLGVAWYGKHGCIICPLDIQMDVLLYIPTGLIHDDHRNRDRQGAPVCPS